MSVRLDYSKDLKDLFGNIFDESFTVNNITYSSDKIKELIMLSNFKGYKCYNNLYKVTPNGLLTRECDDSFSYNLKKGNYFANLDINPIICENDNCIQECYLKLYKEKNEI
jgi:hypothetical protein